MSHTTTCVNGIDVTVWDNARDPMGVESEARRFAGSLPRAGELDDQEGHIDRVEGPSHVGGDIDVWFRGQIVGYSAPEGWLIKDVSGFESDRMCVTLTRE